ncbi:fucose mutarotase isoform X10 [Camelus bactrianus]|uniref:Fucose mutarotase isoform X10 n=1 Tax=Camelus bactrianus TaxID=9837 RepID=A0AC58R4G2_CAMBA
MIRPKNHYHDSAPEAERLWPPPWGGGRLLPVRSAWEMAAAWTEKHSVVGGPSSEGGLTQSRASQIPNLQGPKVKAGGDVRALLSWAGVLRTGQVSEGSQQAAAWKTRLGRSQHSRRPSGVLLEGTVLVEGAPPRPARGPAPAGPWTMVVLKGVPALLSPELLYALARMGHGDEIVLADVNFPTSSICRCGPEEIRADGLGIPQLLEAMLKLLPLDTYVEKPGASVGCVRVVCVEDASAAGQDSTVLQPRTGAWCGVVSSSF